MNSVCPWYTIFSLHPSIGQSLREPHKFKNIPQHVCLKGFDLEALLNSRRFYDSLHSREKEKVEI